MHDLDDDDFKKFEESPEDRVRPIDMGGEQKPKTEKPESDDNGFLGRDATGLRQPTAEEPTSEGEGQTPRPDFDAIDPRREENERGREAVEDSHSAMEERMLRDLDEEEARQKQSLEVSERFLIEKGEYLDLLRRDPALHHIYIAAGWDQRSFENAPVDVDLSLFLINREDETREDEDFVFYNNMVTLDGAVKLMEDNRTGAGDGDDERVYIDLNGVPFDVVRIVCVLSIYDDKLEGYSFDKVRDVYVRMVNNIDGMEVFCFQVPEIELTGSNAVEIGAIVREGPKWYFDANLKACQGGLAEIAKKYGILVMEDTG